LDWPPEQIAGWLKRTHPEDECNRVSHETIYRSLFVQTRGVLKKELLSHLRSKRSMRRSRPVDPNGDRRRHIKDVVSIRQRPAAVEDRAVPGHWEGDLLSGPNNSYIATLVERHTRYVMLAKVAGKDTQTVVSALIKQAKKLPKELYKSQGTYGSSSLYVGDQNRRIFLRSVKARGSAGRTRIPMAC
jgi:IS30 family transposase